MGTKQRRRKRNKARRHAKWSQTLLICFYDCRSVVHAEFVSPNQTVGQPTLLPRGIWRDWVKIFRRKGRISDSSTTILLPTQRCPWNGFFDQTPSLFTGPCSLWLFFTYSPASKGTWKEKVLRLYTKIAVRYNEKWISKLFLTMEERSVLQSMEGDLM